MKKVYLFEELRNMKDAIFLAGPSYRPSQAEFKEPSWRMEAIKVFREAGFDGDFIIPEYRDKENLPSDWTHRKQVDWEVEGLYKAHRILFWIPRDLDKLPAFTTNTEFGNFINSGKLIVGWPEGAERNQYLQDRLDKIGVPRYSTLEEIAKVYMEYQNEPARYYFTSDTHFGSDRTLKYSRRPFINVEQMDLEIISNINRDLRYKDTLIHLGDFGDYLTFESLNCGDMKFFLGNYERDDLENCKVDFLDKYNIRLIDESNNFLNISNPNNPAETQVIYIGHEPTMVKCPESAMCIFGHTHQRHLGRFNGFDVGIDYQYRLFSEEDMWFFINILKNKLWDVENFTNYVGDIYFEQKLKCQLELGQIKFKE